MMKPYVVGAVILLIGTYMLNSWLVPVTDKKRVAFETKWVRKHIFRIQSEYSPTDSARVCSCIFVILIMWTVLGNMWFYKHLIQPD